MDDNSLPAGQAENFGHNTLQLNKNLEQMTEQVENISVHVTWTAYDLVVLRTDPQLTKSFKSLEEEHYLCNKVICGSADDVDIKSTAADQNKT